MKKLYCILLSIMLITSLTACCENASESVDSDSAQGAVGTASNPDNNSSEALSETSDGKEAVIPPKEGRLLLGQSTDKNLASYEPEIKDSHSESFYDESKAAEILTECCGFEVELPYSKTIVNTGYDHDFIEYESSLKSVTVNAKTGQIVKLSFSSLPHQGYIKTLDFETLQTIVPDFVETYFAEYANADIVEGYESYDGARFCYYDYDNYVSVSFLAVDIDSVGNINGIMLFDPPKFADKLPTLTEEDYAEKSQETIELFYDSLGIDAEIKTEGISLMKFDYRSETRIYTVEIKYSYTVIYPDGRKEEFSTDLYYPYAEGNDYEG